jgi:hypothetical protein
MWTRATILGSVLVVWVIVRVALRRRVMHPWFVAFAIVTAGAAVTDAARLMHGAAAYVAHVVAVAAAFSGVAVMAEGLRRESGSPPATHRTALLAFGAIALAAAFVALLPPARITMVGGVITAALLLNAVAPLLQAPRRRIGSMTLVAGIAVYALGRTAIVAAHTLGADERTTIVVADVASALVFGAALLIFGIEDVREARAAAAVGHRQTVA